MTNDASAVIEEYVAACNRAEEMKHQVLAIYMALDSLDKKLRFVLDHGSDFLTRDFWYTGVGNISLYDELYWERHETMTIEDIIYRVTDGFEDENWGEEDIKADLSLAEDEAEAELFKALHHPSDPRAAVLRDLLAKGIGSAVHDW